MRILIACSWALPNAGGVNTYVNQLTKALQRAGHTTDIFSPTPDGQGFRISNKDLYIERGRLQSLIANQTHQYMDHHLPGIDPWIKQSEIDRYCMEAAIMYFGLEEYDMIHAQDIVSAHAMSRVKPPNTPLVTTIHGCLAKEVFVEWTEMGLPEQDQSSPLWRYCSLREYLGATVSDVTITPSQWLKDILVQEFSVPEHHVVVSPYGIDVDEFQQNMMRDVTIMKPTAKKVFMCPARFDAVKGHIYLLHALSKLKEERTDWVCWLVGDGSLRDKLKRAVQELGLTDHVTFLGKRDDIPELLRQADFIVLPSIQDNQPFAIIEAQVAGKPIITSNAGGIPEMIKNDSTGFVFRSGDSDQLYILLRSALENPAMFLFIANQAREQGEIYWSLPALTSRLHELYELARSKHLDQDNEIAPDHDLQNQNTSEGGDGKWSSQRRRRLLLRRKRKVRFLKRRRLLRKKQP
ncbi:glycosyltransferase family 4 protein [Paenibacillus sp. Y412MC10]|uniref:glycosyltransferase family 4 protein n=1 Tax=Geobacillus sp. (strain Y412MC10) TaxID=481743 RepID=UPI0016433072|nr:glycosyltransferase family 4 protein [Paenibacillus sp. Y412MC10]